VAEQCDVLAKRLAAHAERLSPSPAEESLVETLYETAFGRPPTIAEQTAARGFLQAQKREHPSAEPSMSKSSSISSDDSHIPLVRRSWYAWTAELPEWVYFATARAVRRTSLVLRGAGV
jgi:hypothetical protein